jgi:hypothetical protein
LVPRGAAVDGFSFRVEQIVPARARYGPALASAANLDNDKSFDRFTLLSRRKPRN